MSLLSGYKGPRWRGLLKPSLDALKDLDGSGRINEIHEKVIKIFNLADDVIDCIFIQVKEGELLLCVLRSYTPSLKFRQELNQKLADNLLLLVKLKLLKRKGHKI